MVEVAWAAIGLLAVSLFGSTYYLGTRIDALSARIDALSARIDAQGERLDGRIDHLSGLLSDHLGRHAG